MSELALESRIAIGFLRRLAVVAPLALLGGGLVGGWSGAATALVALGELALNFVLMALAFKEGARFGMAGVVVAGLSSLILGLGLLTALTVAVVHDRWMRLGVFAVVVLAGYVVAVGLEARRVAMRLAEDGVVPWKVSR